MHENRCRNGDFMNKEKNSEIGAGSEAGEGKKRRRTVNVNCCDYKFSIFKVGFDDGLEQKWVIYADERNEKSSK